MRTFLAIDISPDVRRRLSRLISDLRKGCQFTGAEPRWVRAESIHLTIKFLGEISEEKIEPIAQAVERVCTDREAIAWSLRGLGVFPNPRRPRVIWIGIRQGAEELGRLQQEVEDVLVPIGFPKEDRPFRPHLTLARLKSSKGSKGLIDVLQGHNRVWGGEDIARSLIFLRSQLRPDGAVYTRLREFPFRTEPSPGTSAMP